MISFTPTLLVSLSLRRFSRYSQLLNDITWISSISCLPRKDGAWPALFQNFCVVLCIVCFVLFYVLFVFVLFYVLFVLCCSMYCLFCVVLCIVCFVLFYVLFVLCCSMYFLFCVVICIFCFVLFYVLFVLCCSVYRLCVKVYCTTATFHWHNPPDRTMALVSTQPLIEMSTRRISWW